MRIKLIAPAWADPLWDKEKQKAIFPPLNLMSVAALTPPEIEVQITDESLEEIDYEQPVDLVGITAMTAVAPRAYQIADRFRARGVPVVLGGLHASALPEEALQHADAVVVGEAEGTWPRLLADLAAGHLQRVYRAGGRASLSGLPAPRRTLLSPARYLVPHTVQTTRGCPFACDFCSVTHFFGHRYRFRPVAEVVQEVRELGAKLVAFVDDNIIGSPRYAKALFRALRPLNIKWFSQGSLNMANDPELLDLAAESGCLGMFVGFESLSPENLQAMNKHQNRAEEFLPAIERLHEHGIAIEGAFVFGFDGDDESVFERTVRFAQRARLEAAQFGILTPFPGTPLRTHLEREGRILSNDWSRYNIGNVLFRPRRMSAETLQEGFNWAWREFYSLRSIARRVGLRHRHAAFLWALNQNIRRRVGHFLDKATLQMSGEPEFSPGQA